MGSDFLCLLIGLGIYLWQMLTKKAETDESLEQPNTGLAPPQLPVQSQDACPSCGGLMRLWDGNMQCWECGYGSTPAEYNAPVELPPPMPESAMDDAGEIEVTPEYLRPDGTNLVLLQVGPNFYRIKKIIAEIRPELSTFDIYEMLKHPPQTVAENLPASTAVTMQQRLEQAECSVQLQ